MRRELLPEGKIKSDAAVGNCLRAKGITAGGEEQVSNGSNGMLEVEKITFWEEEYLQAA